MLLVAACDLLKPVADELMIRQNGLQIKNGYISDILSHEFSNAIPASSGYPQILIVKAWHTWTA
jgi:hypothetical protein